MMQKRRIEKFLGVRRFVMCLLIVLVAVLGVGCSAESVPSGPQTVERFSDADAQQFTVEDLDNPNIVGRLTPEQRKQILKDARKKK